MIDHMFHLKNNIVKTPMIMLIFGISVNIISRIYSVINLNEAMSLEDLVNNKLLYIAANYLSWFLELENDYSVIDKLSRARSDKDVAEALYAALRIKNRLARLAKNENRVPDESIFLNNVVPSERIVSEIIRLASKDPRGLGIVLANLALSMRPYVPKSKEGEK